VDDLTRRVGAANTLRRPPSRLRRSGETASGSPGGWEATNTDVAGFLAPLEQAFGRPLAGARADPPPPIIDARGCGSADVTRGEGIGACAAAGAGGGCN